jgi:hypothetical protein
MFGILCKFAVVAIQSRLVAADCEFEFPLVL